MSSGSLAMTVYEDEIPARRRGVGTKVLALACGILAVLGSFWGIVWFIRSYVEPPRVMMPAAVRLASRDSIPVLPPAPTSSADTRLNDAAPAVESAQAAPAPPAPPAAPPRAAPSAAESDQAAGSVAERWGPMNQFAPTPPAAPVPAPAPAPPPVVSAPAPSDTAPVALTTAAPEKEADEVVEGTVPAITGPAPLPRRRPVMTAQRRTDPPLPRPRPDGQVAPQSVFTAVPTGDERYPGQ
ncbi:MAG TPA: hypothetical protein VK438_19610 [Xanthobacteraceae bacterium]|nr:hypothetical protein [Xanthobacteraceae bacterium]